MLSKLFVYSYTYKRLHKYVYDSTLLFEVNRLRINIWSTVIVCNFKNSGKAKLIRIEILKWND